MHDSSRPEPEFLLGTGADRPDEETSSDRPIPDSSPVTPPATAPRGGRTRWFFWPGMRFGLVAALTAVLAVAAVIESRSASRDEKPDQRAVAERAIAAEEEAASRALLRTPAPTTPSPSVSPTASAKATASPTPRKTRRATPAAKKSTRPARPRPVAGLTQAQMDNAATIVRVGREMGLPRRAMIIAVATAMQESNLYNLASGVLPESMNYPNQGVGWDHDSVGLFQQRPSAGWGAVADLMRPEYAATKFYQALLQVPGWESLPLSVAAQSVQISAFPDAYAQHEARATQVVDALL